MNARVIKRRGRASLKPVLAKPVARSAVERALAVRSAKPFKGKFVRSQAFEE